MLGPVKLDSAVSVSQLSRQINCEMLVKPAGNSNKYGVVTLQKTMWLGQLLEWFYTDRRRDHFQVTGKTWMTQEPFLVLLKVHFEMLENIE